jgi:hypothetical protein
MGYYPVRLDVMRLVVSYFRFGPVRQDGFRLDMIWMRFITFDTVCWVTIPCGDVR